MASPFNPRAGITIDGKLYTAALDLAALYTFEEVFKIAPDQFGKKANELMASNQLKTVAQLLYCMTRSNDPAPTMQQINSMSPAEIFGLVPMVKNLVQVAMVGVPGEKEPDGEKAPGAAAGGKSGTGAKPSRKRRR